MIAFVVTAGPAYVLTKKISANLENMIVIGAALIIGGIVMGLVDLWYGEQATAKAVQPALATVPDDGHEPGAVLQYEPQPELPGVTSAVEQMSLKQAVWIGICQILSAVFPGTSRSMSTIAAGQVAGMTRAAALEFSFYLSIPTMFVATLYSLYKAIFPKHSLGAAIAPVEMDGQKWVILAIGFIVSFFVAWGVVAWFMSWVRRRGFTPFAIYRVIVGAAVLAWAIHHQG
jgi:undecaprenyl-diphosphatase